MRLDHIAYRTFSRQKTAQFFIDALGYHVQQEFTIDFGNGHTAQCIALEPPEKTPFSLWESEGLMNDTQRLVQMASTPIYHLAAEIFVSDGSPGSIVAARGNIGGIHHIAYQVNDVKATMEEWKKKGYAEFASAEPLTCPGLTQVFTRPSVLTGVIYEFINREGFGFCAENVKNLMESTQETGNGGNIPS